ncbi:hypothetical protein GCM10022251_34290 [Phytohabitans flavus]|uniref:Uncharacterized protein n=1 Tax=Phytohabitans flavus TaxID=1076124 RepID=A0A6F8XN03_9ACTN|nr:hypothetical protein [Phytohabitans flavus]BCB75214.1 hypothetical protein Pflav_016240 [Phytohabitans flavus]
MSDTKLNRTLAVVGAGVALIGVPASIVAGRPFSGVMIAVAFMAGVLVTPWWLFRRSGRPHLAVITPVFAATIMIFSVGYGLLASNSGNYIVHTLMGFPKHDRVEIASGSVQKVSSDDGRTYDRFTLAVWNPRDTDRLATKISIYQSRYKEGLCGSNRPYRYRIDGEVILVGNRPMLDGSVRQILSDRGVGRLAVAASLRFGMGWVVAGVTHQPSLHYASRSCW